MRKPTAEQRLKKHQWLAYFWLGFGIAGLLEYAGYLFKHPDQILSSVHPIANSIPVLFFISVYANYASHKAAAEAVRSEMGD
jgi:hypothetical protein